MVTEGSNAEFTVTLSHEVAEQVVVAWSAGSTAQVPASADDYSPDSGSVIFQAGAAAGATRTITMAIADDKDDEERETFTVTLGSVTGDMASRVSVDSAKSSADASIAIAGVVTVTLVGPRAFSHTTYTDQPVNTDQAVYHVFISGPVNADVRVDIATSNGTATGCDWENDANGIATCETGQTGDYGSASETLTIGPTRDDFLGNDVRVLYNTLSVPLIGNATGDPDETFTVSISNLRGGGTTPVVLGDSSVTTTITEDPLTVQVGGLEFVDEGTNARFVVSRNVDLHPALGLRVGYYTKSTEDPDAATVTEDYPYTAGTLEIPVNLTRFATLEDYRQRYSDWEVLVPIVADNIDEPDENFFLLINVPEIYDPGTEWVQDELEQRRLNTAETWIRDRAMRVSVSGPETATEGGYADFTVSLSRPPTANLTVNYQTYSALAPLELATSGEDFTALAGTLTFAPGETSKRVRVPLLTDSITEPIEYFRLLLSNPFGGGGLTPTLSVGEATMGIVDAAGPLYGATMTVSPDSSIGEGDAAASSFTVKVDLDCCTTFAVPTTVTISLGGTATGTDDYTANVANVTIPASTATGSATLTLTPVDDAIVEGGETIVVNGSATVQLNGTATGLLILPTTLDLTDNDTATVGITGPSAEVAEGANAEFTVTLSTEIAKDTTVAWSAPLRSDTAAAADLRATSGTVTFAAGSAAGSYQTISIPVIDDNLPEAAETFTVTLGTVGGDLADLVTVDSTASSAAATIAESDLITINISGPTSVDEGDATTAYTVSLSPSGVTLTADLTVNYATSDGTATAGRDYTAKSGILTFNTTNPGPQTFTVQTTGDIEDEGTGETFTVTISNPSGGGGQVPSLGTSSVITTISDDDDAPVLSISSAPSSVAEGGTATYTVKLEGSRTTDVTVAFATGADSDLATAGKDYTAVDSILTFQPTDDTKTVNVQTLADTRIEVAESFTVSLSNAKGGGGLTPVIKDGSKITTINDDFEDESDYPNSYSLSAAPTSLNEDDGATKITFTATLTTENTFPDVVDIVVLLAGWWEGATATVAEDYTLSGSRGSVLLLSIPTNKNSAEGTFTLTPVNDKFVESDETIIFDSLSGGGMTTTDKPTITIRDNDPELADITLSANPSILREGSESATTNVVVTATLNDTTHMATPTIVSVSLEDGTAKESSDYSAANATVTITAGESSGSATLGVPLLADTIEEEDEKLGVTGTAQGFTVSPAELIILDDDRTDPTDIVLFASPSMVQEDAGATDVHVLATLRGGIALTTDTAIDLSLGDGTATLAGGDYTASTGTVTILAEQLIGTGTITVTPKTDAIVEPDETVAIKGKVNDSELDVASEIITIRDINTADISISGPTGNVSEGSDATFTVTLSHAVDAEVQVAWSALSGTDSAEAADLDSTSGTVTFAANSAAGATQDITITVEDDSLSETAESFTVTLGSITSTLSSKVSLKNGAGSAQGTIAKSDAITVSISGPSSVDEGDATTDYTVSLSPSGVTPTADLTVSYKTAAGTATAGTDYTAIPATTLTFTPADHADKTFTVTTTEDTFYESDETFTVLISNPSGGGGPTPVLDATRSVETSITDDDAAISDIALSVKPTSIGEDDSATSVAITATIQGGSTLPSGTFVFINALGGTAAKGTDYEATSLIGIGIAGGRPAARIASPSPLPTTSWSRVTRAS